MEVTLLLCDFAEVLNGKIYIMGAGWDRVMGGMPINAALAILIQVPWEQTNQRHSIAMRLVTEDGAPVVVNDEPVVGGGEFEIGRPPGSTPGATSAVPLASRFPTVVFAPGRYRVEIEIDGSVEATRSIQAIGVQ